MDQQDRLVDLVGVHERRDLEVRLRRLPQRSPLALEAEGADGVVVGPAASDAGTEEIRVSQESRGHQCAVTVPDDAHALRIGHADLHRLGDGGLSVGDELLDKRVVGRVRIADDRHGSAFQHRVSVQEKEQGSRPGELGERPVRTGHLSRGAGIGVLERIGFEHGRQARSVLVPRWQVEGEG